MAQKKDVEKEEKEKYFVSSDAGGTMTDMMIMDTKGNFKIVKGVTNPNAESQSFMATLKDAVAEIGVGVDGEEDKKMCANLLNVTYSGTSIVNTLITRAGAKVGLITTRGNEYMLLQGRGKEAVAGYRTPEKIHVAYRKHKEPFVSFDLIKSATERIDQNGKVWIPLYEEEVEQAVKELLSEDVDSIAISFLSSYANPEHELRAREIAEEVMKKEGKSVPVYLSFDVSPHVREVSRTNALVIQAYAVHRVKQELIGLERELQERGYTFPLQIVLSYGMTASIAYPRLVEAACCGPIGGITGVKYLGEIIGERNIVGADMGGTSFDIGIITNGIIPLEREPEFQRMYINVPMLKLSSEAGGGGGYVRIDPYSQRITIGPDSAGSIPGPVCWDRGNEVPTMTDCDLILGRINPDYYLNGKIKLNKDKALESFEKNIAKKLNMDVYEAAEGVIELYEVMLAEHIRRHMAGYDYREHMLFSYGGGGGLHLAGYSAGNPWKRVSTIPWAPVFSSFGGAAMDYGHRYSTTTTGIIPLKATTDEKMSVSEMINRTWKKLGEEAEQNFMSEGVPKRSVNFIRFMFMQYLGQLHDVEVMLPDITRIDSPDALKGVIAEFEKVYESIFGKEAKNPGAGYKITEIGLIAKAPKVKPQMRRYELGGEKPSKSSFKGTRKVYYKVRWQDAKIYEMEELVPGNEVHGLCIIESPYYTVFVPPGKKVVQDEFRLLNLIDVN